MMLRCALLVREPRKESRVKRKEDVRCCAHFGVEKVRTEM